MSFRAMRQRTEQVQGPCTGHLVSNDSQREEVCRKPLQPEHAGTAASLAYCCDEHPEEQRGGSHPKDLVSRLVTAFLQKLRVSQRRVRKLGVAWRMRTR